MNEQFQVGQEVAVKYNYGRSHYVKKIAHITPGGRITLEGGAKFRPSGEAIEGSKWDRRCLVPLTDELRVKIQDEQNLERLRGFDKWKDLTADQRARIVAILKEKAE